MVGDIRVIRRARDLCLMKMDYPLSPALTPLKLKLKLSGFIVVCFGDPE
jgi:hypothetical protein